MLDRALGIAGIAIGLLTWAIGLLWAKLPPWVPLTGFATGGALLMFALGMMAGTARRSTASDIAKPVKTTLRLQFYGNHRVPTMLHEDNIARWFAMYSASQQIAFLDNEGRQVGQTGLPKTWTILVVFDRPALFSEIRSHFSESRAPLFEIRDSSTRHAVVYVAGDVPAGELELNAIPATRLIGQAPS